MKFLNGWKTILGIGACVLATVKPQWVPALGNANDIVNHGVAIVQGAGAMLGVLGVIHKVEKARS